MLCVFIPDSSILFWFHITNCRAERCFFNIPKYSVVHAVYVYLTLPFQFLFLIQALSDWTHMVKPILKDTKKRIHV